MCTTEADGGHSLLDFYENPTPKSVDKCADPQPFYFLEVEYDAANAYGPGTDTHTIDFELPEGATVDRVGLYYGPRVSRFVLNDNEIDADAVYKVFPVRSSTFVAVDSPMKYSLVNESTALLDAYLVDGQNAILVETQAEKDFEERPFYFYTRFTVPSGQQGAQPIVEDVEEGDGGGVGWWVPAVAGVVALAVALMLGWLVYRRRRRVTRAS